MKIHCTMRYTVGVGTVPPHLVCNRPTNRTQVLLCPCCVSSTPTKTLYGIEQKHYCALNFIFFVSCVLSRPNVLFYRIFQLYLSVRYGRPASEGILAEILSAVERAREFSAKLREFLAEVTRCGLQDQVSERSRTVLLRVAPR